MGGEVGRNWGVEGRKTTVRIYYVRKNTFSVIKKSR